MKTIKILILGKSNVGKSSLINFLINNHSALVSNKLHATRISTSHSYKYKDYNIELVDTPGASITTTNLLSQAMKSHASKHIMDADIIILLTHPQRTYDYELKIKDQIDECNKNYFICVNKSDLQDSDKSKEIFCNKLGINDLLMISLKDSLGIDKFFSVLDEYINNIDTFHDHKTNKKNDLNIIQELIRETVINRTNKELPYESAVCITNYKKQNNSDIIKADIIVSKSNHKKIIIGKNGDMIKTIGMKSREKIESYLNKKIYLSLFVVVKENWKNDANLLKDYGYIE
tara:strand:+ start:883 stop:1749 length:867 start_codon:yes stop_codon:yes gene_type:complete